VLVSEKGLVEQVEEKMHKVEETSDLIWNHQEHLSSIVENDTSGIITTDIHGKIKVCNEAACRIFKISVNTGTADNIKLLFKTGDFEKIMECFFRSVTSSDHVVIRNKEIDMVDIEKKPVKVNLSIRKISARLGNPISILFIFQDLREIRLLETRVFHDEKLKLIGQIAAGISHEINTPLGMVKGSLEIMQPNIEKMDDVSRRHIELIDQAVERASKFVEEILAFARPRKEKFAYLSVHELIRKAVSIYKLKHLSEKIKLDYSLSNDDPGIYGDIEQLTRVLTNLFDNACDAMNGDGTIIVSTESRVVKSTEIYCEGYKQHRKDDLPESEFLLQRKKDIHVLNHLSPFAKPGDSVVVINIADTGKGIPADVLPKIFDLFFSTKPSKGTGLGLAIVQGIIKRHMGAISVETQDDKGTKFIVKLPTYHSWKDFERTALNEQ